MFQWCCMSITQLPPQSLYTALAHSAILCDVQPIQISLLKSQRHHSLHSAVRFMLTPHLQQSLWTYRSALGSYLMHMTHTLSGRCRMYSGNLEDIKNLASTAQPTICCFLEAHVLELQHSHIAPVRAASTGHSIFVRSVTIPSCPVGFSLHIKPLISRGSGLGHQG